MSEMIITPIGRLSFSSLWEPNTKAFGGQASNKYEATIIFDENTDLSELRAQASEFAYAAFNGNIPDGLRNPFKDGAAKVAKDQNGNVIPGKYREGYGPGTVYISTSSIFAPPIVDEVMLPITDKSRIKDGDYVKLMCEMFKWTHPANGSGISFGLRAVQFARAGDPFSKGVDVTQFGALEKQTPVQQQVDHGSGQANNNVIDNPVPQQNGAVNPGQLFS